LVECNVEEIHSSSSVLSPSDGLRNHRIVINRYLRAFFHSSVNSDLRMGLRLLILSQEANGREELAGRVFGIHSVLHRMAVDLHIILLEGELMSGGDKNLLLN